MVRLFKALAKYPDRYIQWPLLAFCCHRYIEEGCLQLGLLIRFGGKSSLSLCPKKEDETRKQSSVVIYDCPFNLAFRTTIGNRISAPGGQSRYECLVLFSR